MWQLFGSATLYSDTVLAIMNQYNWTRIGVVYDTIYIHIVEHIILYKHSHLQKQVLCLVLESPAAKGLLSTIRKTIAKTIVIVTVLDHQQAIATRGY